MRIGKRGFAARIKGFFAFEFGGENLTSYAGLELVRRFVVASGMLLALQKWSRKLAVGGDFSFGKTILTVVAMLLGGGKRLSHLSFMGNDPMVLRFAGLSHPPTPRTLSRNLSRMNWRTWSALDHLSTTIVRESLPESIRRWTLDIDGTVLSTGLQVERAKRGYNPHHRKNPSYYPILGTLAQTGQVIGHLNRRGNVHDSHRSAEFLRDTVRTMRRELGMRGVIEVRADSAFFKRDFLAQCDRLRVEYAVKVPMWSWLNIRGLVKDRADSEWKNVDSKGDVQALFAALLITPWNRVERVAIYRKRTNHRPVKGQQLELFNPDDGYWEYSVVATNKTLDMRALYHFHNGRGAQEKTIGELKSGYAFATIPTQSYAANTAWQKLNVLAHNLVTSFQLKMGAKKKTRTLKRTTSWLVKSINSLRVEWLNKAARLVRPGGAPVLRLVDNPATRERVQSIEHALDAA